jgi:hypothetical protein
MPLASSPIKFASRSKLRKTRPRTRIDSLNVIAEIKAYIAIRNDLLAEAEQLKTRAKIDSATVANDFVQSCLKPARPPYESQCLPEAVAVRERKRCEAARRRLAELRAATTTNNSL